MIKYKVTTYFTYDLTEVEVERETDKFVFFPDGLREAKDSRGVNYFDTKPEAKAFMINHMQREIDRASKRLEYLNGTMKKAQAL